MTERENEVAIARLEEALKKQTDDIAAIRSTLLAHVQREDEQFNAIKQTQMEHAAMLKSARWLGISILSAGGAIGGWFARSWLG